MTQRRPSSFVRQKDTFRFSIAFSDQFVLFCRLLLIIANFIFVLASLGSWLKFFPLMFQSVGIFFLLCYVLVSWFGSRFLSYRLVHLILSIFDIIAVSTGLYYLPEYCAEGAFIVYLVGIIFNTFYGGPLTSIGLSFLATTGFILVGFAAGDGNVNAAAFYYKILNLNLITLLLSFLGLKITKTIFQAEQEKNESKMQLLRLQALSRIAKEIVSELQLDKLLMLIVQKSIDLTKAEAGGMVLCDTDQAYRIKAAKGFPKGVLGTEVAPGGTGGLAGRALTEKKIIRDKNSFEPVAPDAPLDLEHYRHGIAAPIWFKDGIMGSIFLVNNGSEPFSKDDQVILEALCEHAAIALTNANTFKTTTTLSLNDYLTGVGNLRFFYQQLEYHLALAQRYQQQCSLLIVDSDSLKEINDNYGNTEGFHHIKQLADVLKSITRTTDLIARYDRDMFMVILPQTENVDAIALAERIRKRIAETPLIINKHQIKTTVSIGVTFFHPRENNTVHSMVRTVESALRQAKSQGKDQIVMTEFEDAAITTM